MVPNLNMDIINFIRNLIFAPTDNRKRRLSMDENVVSSKIRRINTSPLINTMDDDWHSTSSSGSIRSRGALRNSSLGTKLKPSWSKDNVVLTLDDDDDVLEIPKVKHKSWMDPPRSSARTAQARGTSTPNYPIQRLSFHQNGDDEVTFLRSTQSTQEKKLNARKQGFDYINKPYTHFNDKGGNTNGTSHNHSSSILNSAKEIKEKLSVKRRPNVRSNILDQSFRLEEKAKYKQLLADNAISKSNNIRDSFAKYSTPVGKLFNDNLSRGRKLVDLALLKTKPAAIIDLTAAETNNKRKTRLSTKDTIKKVLSDFDNETVNIKDSDSDVEILPTPPSPKPDIQVERINSLKKVLDTTERVHAVWIKQLVQKYKDDVVKCERDIRIQTEQRNKLAAVTSEVHAQRLEEQMLKCLHIKDAVLPIQISEEASLPELSDEDESKIDVAISRRGNPNEIVAQKFNLNITRRDIQTLAGLNWLNDEVINFYMNLIIERGKDSKWPKAYAMNTFFYPKLQKDGASSLRRWTRRIDIFAHEVIAVPIHLGVHWCMSIIDFRIKTIRYYDSMGSSNKQCLQALLKYLEVEHLDKKKMEYDVSDWTLENVQDIPQQMNGSDCGMFSCTFAEFITRNAKLSFTQENMPYLRRKMVLEILNGELLIQ